jgi:hypothetical protein
MGYDVAVKGLSVVVRGIGGNGYNGMEKGGGRLENKN